MTINMTSSAQGLPCSKESLCLRQRIIQVNLVNLEHIALLYLQLGSEKRTNAAHLQDTFITRSTFLGLETIPFFDSIRQPT